MSAVARLPRGARPQRHYVFFRTRYTPSLSKAVAHVHYIAFRSRELPEEQRGVFDRTHDSAPLRPFLERLRSDPVIQPPRAAKLHKFTIGMMGRDYREAGIDYRVLVRRLMARLEQQIGGRLDWVAAVHHKERSPHVHIALRASYLDRDTGRVRRLRIDQRLREWIAGEIRREVHRDLEPVLERRRQQQRQQAPDRTQALVFRTVAGLLTWLAEMQCRWQREARERERQRRRREREERERGEEMER